MALLPDLLEPDLKIVFCGTALSHKSHQVQAYYGNPGNFFWRTLFEAGLTPYQLKPADYRQLLSFGLGLTDLVKDQYGQDRELKFSSQQAHVLKQKILTYQPKAWAFTSKTAAQKFLGTPQVAWGPQSQRIGQTQLIVLPSTSGLARSHWPAQRHHWMNLRNYLAACSGVQKP